jgi:hypothetical protein
VLTNSTLVYKGTPLVALSLYKKEDLEFIQAQLYREVNSLSNIFSQKAIMNMACCMQKLKYLLDERLIKFQASFKCGRGSQMPHGGIMERD